MVWNTWAIDGDVNTDVKHPASVARLQTFVAFEGVEGIVNPLDMRVMALDIPGTAIRVMPGAGAVLNRATGSESQAYAIQNYGSPDEKQITATDSGGGRSDLVVVRVENPFIAGENFDLPADPQNGPYTKVRIVEGVPAGTIDYHDLEPGTYGDVTVSATDSAITLARIDIPASTATIQQSYIKDLRSMAQLGGKRVGETVVEQNPWTESSAHVSPTQDAAHVLANHNDVFYYWPPEADWQVPVPAWATGVDVWLEIDCQLRDGHAWGSVFVEIEGSTAGFQRNEFDLNYVGNPSIETVKYRGTLPLRPEYRGRMCRFRTKARLVSDGEIGRLWAKDLTYTSVMLTFKKNPSYT